MHYLVLNLFAKARFTVAQNCACSKRFVAPNKNQHNHANTVQREDEIVFVLADSKDVLLYNIQIQTRLKTKKEELLWLAFRPINVTVALRMSANSKWLRGN